MDNFQTTRKPLTITLDAQSLFYPHSPSWPSSLSSAPARPQDASEWTVSSTIQQEHRRDKNAEIGQLNFKTRSHCWGFRLILVFVYFLKQEGFPTATFQNVCLEMSPLLFSYYLFNRPSFPVLPEWEAAAACLLWVLPAPGSMISLCSVNWIPPRV